MISDALLSCLVFLLGCIFVISMGVSAAALFAWGYTKDNSFFVQFIETSVVLFTSCAILTYLLYFT
jgi:NADH:ubiquinone oxidoreductase subunit 3 (subunit A)